MFKLMYMLISPDLMMVINRVYVLQSITLYTRNMCNRCQLQLKKILDFFFFFLKSFIESLSEILHPCFTRHRRMSAWQ